MVPLPVRPRAGRRLLDLPGRRRRHFHRANVLRKARGLTDADRRPASVPSLTTLAGLLKHLTLVEGNWFRCLFAPEPGDV
ncbi:hypothetical protein DRA43_25005, partial [Micromonospora provocatoris]